MPFDGKALILATRYVNSSRFFNHRTVYIARRRAVALPSDSVAVAEAGRSSMRSILIGPAFATIIALASQASASANLVANGDFATGDFTDWTLFTTSNGTLGPSPNPQVVMFNVTGGGAQNAAKFNVGEVNFDETQQGGGIFQDITTSAGLLDFSAAIASFASGSTGGNDSAGVFSVLLNGVVEATEDLGRILPEQELMGSLSFSAPVSRRACSRLRS
jgi:hypothetical protein